MTRELRTAFNNLAQLLKHEQNESICDAIATVDEAIAALEQPENGTCSNKCECSHLNQTCDKTPTNRFRTASGDVVHLCRRCAEHSYGCDGFALTPAQHQGNTITTLEQMAEAVADRVTLHEAGLPIETEKTPQELLDIAAEKQTEFWDAMTELEAATGMDLDSTQDLQGCTVDDLIEN